MNSSTNNFLVIQDHINNLCRFCGQPTKASQTTFERLLKNNQICKQFDDFFGIELKKEATLPSLICTKCNKMLPKYLKFHQQCINSYYHLKSVKLVIKRKEIEEPEQFKIETPESSFCLPDNLEDSDSDQALVVKRKKIEEPEQFKIETPESSFCLPDNLEDSDSDQALSPEQEEVTEQGAVRVETIRSDTEAKAVEVISGAEMKVVEEPIIETIEKMKYNRKSRQCNVCGAFVQRIKYHMELHRQDKYICNFCNRHINLKCNLTKHLRIHLKIRNFKCHLCEKAFTDSSTLKLHIEVHKGTKNYKCDKCDKTFNAIRGLRSHEQFIHYKVFKLLCEICDARFIKSADLRKHMFVHAERLKCKFCDATLKNQKSLDFHERIHTKPPEFVCEICSRLCHSKLKLNWHKKCHENLKGRVHMEHMKRLPKKNVNYLNN